jgi:hypothetical protein
MQWGIDNEPYAINAYENINDVMVIGSGFVDHKRISFCGVSPDGLIGNNGCIEVKCPNTTTHADTLLTGAVPKDYMPQILLQLSTLEREWCDFVSYDPRLIDERLRIKIIRVYRDDAAIKELESAIEIFNGNIDFILSQLKTDY